MMTLTLQTRRLQHHRCKQRSLLKRQLEQKEPAHTMQMLRLQHHCHCRLNNPAMCRLGMQTLPLWPFRAT
jgi:hypothetical protein